MRIWLYVKRYLTGNYVLGSNGFIFNGALLACSYSHCTFATTEKSANRRCIYSVQFREREKKERSGIYVKGEKTLARARDCSETTSH